MKVYFDTNVLVAALQPDHIHHARSFAAYGRVQAGAIAGYISCHGLTELYSVLTRTPWKIPVSPREILAVIEQSILPGLRLSRLRGRAIWLRLGFAAMRDGRAERCMTRCIFRRLRRPGAM